MPAEPADDLRHAAVDARVHALLTRCRRIAVVGASPKAHRASNRVMAFLGRHGYETVAVNPGHERIDGVPCYPRLADVPGPVDMVDVFRRSERAGDIVDQAIALKDEKGIQGVWLQLGVIDNAAAERAAAAGLIVVMDRCPAIELPRLGLG